MEKFDRKGNMLDIKLFGAGQLSYKGQTLAGFPHQLPFLVLSYVLLNRQYPQPRERLAAIFWGDQSSNNARKCLRNALWRLRTSLQSIGVPVDDNIFLNEENIAFTETSHYGLDVERFETITGKYQDVLGQKLSASQAGELEEGVALYTGDLLECVYEDWCLNDRERLRLLHFDMLNKLIIYYGVAGFYERGLDCGKRLLALDNAREKVHQQLMWLYWLSGNRNSALAQYKHLCQILKEELGIGPMHETQLLYEQMLHDRFDPRNWFEGIAATPQTGEQEVLSVGKESSQSAHPLNLEILMELRRLEEMIDETRNKSRYIESLISQSLINSKPPKLT
jgi:DNA-binding SARP family transcriptional activator